MSVYTSSPTVDRTLYNWKGRNAIPAARQFPYQRKSVCALARLDDRTPIIAHPLNSWLEFNHRTSMKHANVVFLVSMITGQWWVDETDWCALTGHGLHLTNINSIASLKKSMRVVYTRLFQFSVDGMWRWCCFPCILRDNERERERGRRKCASIFFFVYFINWIERTEWTMGSLREEIGDSAPSSSPSNRIRVENSFSANWKWY